MVRIRDYRRRAEGPHMSEQEQLVMWAIRTLRLQRAQITAEAVQSLLSGHAIVEPAKETQLREREHEGAQEQKKEDVMHHVMHHQNPHSVKFEGGEVEKREEAGSRRIAKR